MIITCKRFWFSQQIYLVHVGSFLLISFHSIWVACDLILYSLRLESGCKRTELQGGRWTQTHFIYEYEYMNIWIWTSLLCGGEGGRQQGQQFLPRSVLGWRTCQKRCSLAGKVLTRRIFLDFSSADWLCCAAFGQAAGWGRRASCEGDAGVPGLTNLFKSYNIIRLHRNRNP